MLGRIYTVFFICLMIFAFWYQTRYLQRASKEFNAQLDSKNFVLPTSTIKNFITKAYDKDILKYFFSGDKITYFTDGHFEAEGHLIYKEFGKKPEDIVMLRAEKATGQLDANDSTSLILGNNIQLKYAYLPEKVLFNFNGNKGQASNVKIDIAAQSLQSDEFIETIGPNGEFRGKGFYYSMKDEEFKIKSEVSGKVNSPQSLQKM